MFDAPLTISFGPPIDRMFVAALALIIFVYGTTAVMWIVAEITKLVKWVMVRWFGLEPEVEYETFDHEIVSDPESSIMYEVMWSSDVDSTYASNTRRRVVAEPRVGGQILLRENGDGFIRYRVWDRDQVWGLATWHEGPKLDLPKFGVDQIDVTTLSGDPIDVNFNKKAEDGNPV